MMKRWLSVLSVLAALCMAVTSCFKDAHIAEYPLEAERGAFIVGLQSANELNLFTLYIFDANGNIELRKDYDDPRVLADEYNPVDAGSHTVVVVGNVDPLDLPTEITALQLNSWLKSNSEIYPTMLTASRQADLADGEVKRILLTLKSGAEGIAITTLRLLLTLPPKDMYVFTPSTASVKSSGEELSLRCVSDVYRQGTTELIYHGAVICEPMDDGTYAAEVDLLDGSYDIRLWADWTLEGTLTDRFYNADDLNAVSVLTTDYHANGMTDEKDAYFANISTTVAYVDPDSVADANSDDADSSEADANSSADAADETDANSVDFPVEMTRPFGRYRIVANDVEAYKNLMEKDATLPSIENLSVRVSYEGFFPTCFCVPKEVVGDAFAGISYSAGIIEASGYEYDQARQVGADYVLSDPEGSFVSVSVSMVDVTTGEQVSTVNGVQIPYRRGYITTVTGTFLTAGRVSGGVEIDTEWKEEVIIPF